MDLKSIPVTEEEKTQIYGKLVDVIIAALENGEIAGDEDSDAAGYILDRMETVQSKYDLITFLEELSIKWEMFKNVYLDEKKDELLLKVTSELHQMT